MKIRDYIFSNDIYYSAHYGWQKEFNESTMTFGYINSYKESGDALVELRNPDLMLFPIVFNYRHYLELILKNICEKNMDRNEYILFIKSVSHNLVSSWENAKLFLKNYLSKEQILFIEEIIKVFNDLDPNSMTFRYEKNKNLKKSIKSDELIINTFYLKKYIDIVDDILRFTYDY